MLRMLLTQPALNRCSGLGHLVTERAGAPPLFINKIYVNLLFVVAIQSV